MSLAAGTTPATMEEDLLLQRTSYAALAQRQRQHHGRPHRHNHRRPALADDFILDRPRSVYTGGDRPPTQHCRHNYHPSNPFSSTANTSATGTGTHSHSHRRTHRATLADRKRRDFLRQQQTSGMAPSALRAGRQQGALLPPPPSPLRVGCTPTTTPTQAAAAAAASVRGDNGLMTTVSPPSTAQRRCLTTDGVMGEFYQTVEGYWPEVFVLLATQGAAYAGGSADGCSSDDAESE